MRLGAQTTERRQSAETNNYPRQAPFALSGAHNQCAGPIVRSHVTARIRGAGLDPVPRRPEHRRMNDRSKLLLPIVLACSGCGAGTDTLKSTASLEAFPTFCTGTLSKQSSVGVAAEAGAWFGQGEAVASGTPVLVGLSFGRWDAYGLLADGTPFKVDSDSTKGLTLDTDFSASCASAGRINELPSTVLLQDADIYSAEEQTGAPCALKRGTALSNFSFSAAQKQGGAAKVLSAEIKTTCGFEQGYSDKISYAPLIAK